MCAVCLHQCITIQWKCSGMQVTQILLWHNHVLIKFTIEQHTVDDSEVVHIASLEQTRRYHIPDLAPWLHMSFNSVHTVHSAKFLLGAVCQYLLKTKDTITHHSTKQGYWPGQNYPNQNTEFWGPGQDRILKSAQDVSCSQNRCGF